jgi:hypothetical protein
VRFNKIKNLRRIIMNEDTLELFEELKYVLTTKEFDELERLVKIGYATEKAFEEGYSLMKLLYTVKLDMRYEDEYEEDVYEEIENLLEWAEREG